MHAELLDGEFNIKGDLKHADSLSASHSGYDFASRHISLPVLPTNSLSVSHACHSPLLSEFHLFVTVDVPPPEEADRGRQVIDSGERGMKEPPVGSSVL